MTDERAIEILRGYIYFDDAIRWRNIAQAALVRQVAVEKVLEELVKFSRYIISEHRYGAREVMDVTLNSLLAKYDAAKKGTNEQPPQ